MAEQPREPFLTVPYDTVAEGEPLRSGRRLSPKASPSTQSRLSDELVHRFLMGEVPRLKVASSYQAGQFWGRVLEMIVGDRWEDEEWLAARIEEIGQAMKETGFELVPEIVESRCRKRPRSPVAVEKKPLRPLSDLLSTTLETIDSWSAGRNVFLIVGTIHSKHSNRIYGWRVIPPGERDFGKDYFKVRIARQENGRFRVTMGLEQHALLAVSLLKASESVEVLDEVLEGIRKRASVNVVKPENPHTLGDLRTVSREKVCRWLGERDRITITGQVNQSDRSRIKVWTTQPFEDRPKHRGYFYFDLAKRGNGFSIVDAGGAYAASVVAALKESGAILVPSEVVGEIQKRAFRGIVKSADPVLSLSELRTLGVDRLKSWMGDATTAVLTGLVTRREGERIRSWRIVAEDAENPENHLFQIVVKKNGEDSFTVVAGRGAYALCVMDALGESKAVTVLSSAREEILQRIEKASPRSRDPVRPSPLFNLSPVIPNKAHNHNQQQK